MLRTITTITIGAALALAFTCTPAAAGAIPQTPVNAAQTYAEHCAKCHGADGTPPATAPSKVTPFDFTKCSVASAEPDTAWRLAVAHGGPSVGLSSEMPAFADKLSPAAIDAVVEHLRNLCIDKGWPNGNLNFSRPILTEKAFPEDEVVILPVFVHQKDAPDEMEIAAVVEKRFGKRSNIEIEVPFASVASGGRQTGVGDLEFAAKHVLLADRAGSRIVSGGLEVAFPTGNESKGLGEHGVRYEPFVAAGLARNLATLQGTFAVEFAREAEEGEEELEHEVEYNVFFGRDLSALPTRWTVGIELNGENKELSITPQVRKGLVKTGALAAAIGIQVPLNARDERHTRVVGYLLWDYREPVRRRR